MKRQVRYSGFTGVARQNRRTEQQQQKKKKRHLHPQQQAAKPLTDSLWETFLTAELWKHREPTVQLLTPQQRSETT